MKNFLRQSVGIDVSQKELVVNLARVDEQGCVESLQCKTFTNTPDGFKQLRLWSGKSLDPEISILYVMEATGVYHEKLAYWLVDQGLEVSIVLPNKISNYFRSLEIKTITDKTSCQVIARFGVERKLELWQKPQKVFRSLKQLTREHLQLIQERTFIKNQLHSEQTEMDSNEDSIIRMKDRIKLLNKQLMEIKREIKGTLEADNKVKEQVQTICTIVGVGTHTAASVLGETNGFELIRNKRQLVSYAGLDVKEKQSGTSVKGKPRISKRGNKYLRRAMHFPALTAIRHDERMKAVYARLISKHGIKMKAAVAVQRKMLELIYIIWKNKTTYDRQYLTRPIKELEQS